MSALDVQVGREDAVTVVRDLVFSTVPGFRPLELDLYAPRTTPRAVCVYAHGGGWRVGWRRQGPGPVSATSTRWLTRIAAQGLAVASVDYRLSGEATFPAARDDLAAACDWLVHDAASAARGLPLVLFGVSAGGNLAALCGLEPALRARAVALWYPVTDVPAMPDDLEAAGLVADRGPGSREALMLGGAAADVPAIARAASPVALVDEGAPPFLLAHGTADRAVPVRQSERLHEALTSVGVESRLLRLEGHDHLLPGMADDELADLVDATAAFLLENVGS